MTRIKSAIQNSLAWILITCLLLPFAGCNGPNTVKAIPRTESNEPEFGAGKPLTPIERSNELDFSFVHEDHFACISINVQKVISNPDLKEVPWDSLESQLAELIGAENSDLKNVDRVWVLLDRDSMSFGEESESKSPLIVVVDFNAIPNESMLIELAQKSASESASAGKGVKLVVTKVGDHRIVIGSVSLTSKVSTGSGDSSLARQLKQMKLDADVDGLIEIRPIRSTMQSMFDMIGTFGGEQVAKFSRLPEVLQRVELSLSLDSKEMLQAIAYIDDDEMVKELAILANETNQSGTSPLMGAGMPFGFGGARPDSGDEPTMMIRPTSVDVITEVGKEISEKGLFSIKGMDRKLTLKLERPGKMKELITASLIDAKQQIELAARVEKLTQIGNAMEAYVDKYNCFPPAGVVNESPDGLPNQFNWRVGLLPFLDQQELYDQFDFSLPWDESENQEVAKKMPSVFASLDSDSSKTSTSETLWHVVGGNIGLYEGSRNPKPSDIKDKKIWTALVVEGSESSAVNWTEPGALEVETVDVARFGNADEHGVLFLNASFDVRGVKRDPEKLLGVLTPGGNENLQRKDFLSVSPGR